MDNQEVYYNKYINYKLKYLRLKKEADNNSLYDDEINYLEGLMEGGFKDNPNYTDLPVKEQNKYLERRKAHYQKEKTKLIKAFKTEKKDDLKAYNKEFKEAFEKLKKSIKDSMNSFKDREQKQGLEMKRIFNEFQKTQANLINNASNDLKASKKEFYEKINTSFANALKDPIEKEYNRQKGEIEKFNISVNEKLDKLIGALNAGFLELTQKLNKDKKQDSEELKEEEKEHGNLFDRFKKKYKETLEKLKKKVKDDFNTKMKSAEWLSISSLSDNTVSITGEDSPYKDGDPTKTSKWGVKLEDPINNKKYTKSNDIKNLKKIQNSNEFKDAEKIQKLEKKKLEEIQKFKKNTKSIEAPKELGGKESGRIPPDPFDEKKVADLIKKQLDDLSKKNK